MLNSSRKPTIRDVAQMAHVSTATVSQIINGVDEFSDETVRRVWDVVNALHYRPNKLAKQLLASRHSEQPREKTGLILRAVFYPHDGDISIELEQKCGYAFERQCAKKGLYGVNYLYRHQVGFHCSLLLKDLIDGVVLCLPHKKIIQSLAGYLPVVLTDLNCDPEEVRVPVVNMDFAAAFRSALIDLGGRKLLGKIAVLNVDYAQTEFFYVHHNSDILDAVASLDMEVAPRFRIKFSITNETHSQVMKQVAGKISDLIRKDGIRVALVRDACYAQTLAEYLEKEVSPVNFRIVAVGECRHPLVYALPDNRDMLYDAALDVLTAEIKNGRSPLRKYIVPYQPSAPGRYSAAEKSGSEDG